MFFDTSREHVDWVYMSQKHVEFSRFFQQVSPICLWRVHVLKTCRFQGRISTCFAHMLIGCTCPENMLISSGFFDVSRRYVYGVYVFFGRVDSGSRIRQVWCGGWVFFGGVGHGRCRVGYAIRRGPTCGREPACVGTRLCWAADLGESSCSGLSKTDIDGVL